MIGIWWQQTFNILSSWQKFLFVFFISYRQIYFPLDLRVQSMKFNIKNSYRAIVVCINSNQITVFFLFFHWLLLFSILSRGIQAICKQNLVIAVTQTSNPLVRSEAILFIYDVLILSINLYKDSIVFSRLAEKTTRNGRSNKSNNIVSFASHWPIQLSAYKS